MEIRTLPKKQRISRKVAKDAKKNKERIKKVKIIRVHPFDPCDLRSILPHYIKEPELNNLPIYLKSEDFPLTKSFRMALWIEDFR